MTKVFISDTKKGVKAAVEEMFTNLEKDGLTLKVLKMFILKLMG